MKWLHLLFRRRSWTTLVSPGIWVSHQVCKMCPTATISRLLMLFQRRELAGGATRGELTLLLSGDKDCEVLLQLGKTSSHGTLLCVPKGNQHIIIPLSSHKFLSLERPNRGGSWSMAKGTASPLIASHMDAGLWGLHLSLTPQPVMDFCCGKMHARPLHTVS